MREKQHAVKRLDETRILRYYLLEKEPEKLFGVAVLLEKDSGEIEREEAIFTEREEEALAAAELLSRNLVTPVSLLCILDEWSSAAEL